ncbi:Gx transporter family protein [Clostridium ganghwense]|uniref:Gx transporter family protein n=1 Tax=Clostridium ganghwense TaxID=312089 RepID=A0ABT4CUB8_9CLOT|nr:Gx transporter family protein [Clostridium ganghwense]MCY6372664.1 Gx transporter family protein [Clostridium ganghwense]
MQYQIKRVHNITKTQKIIFIALLVAQAIVLSIIEKMIPLNFSVPGAKLGLANIITLTSIYIFSFREAFFIIILRTIMTSFILGSFSSFLYSVAGAILSFFVMYTLILISREKISIIGVSLVGAVFHNLGQLLVAMVIIQNAKIMYYLPLLMISGVGTGFVVGVCVKYLLGFIKKLKHFN